MTITQQRQQLKGECFNKLLRIFHPKSNWKCSEFPRDMSFGDKRDEEVKAIFDDYFEKLEKLNKKHKQNENNQRQYN